MHMSHEGIVSAVSENENQAGANISIDDFSSLVMACLGFASDVSTCPDFASVESACPGEMLLLRLP